MRAGVYLWRDQTYIGQEAVALAAGVAVQTVQYHLLHHGNLDRLGVGHQCNWPKDGRGARKCPVAKFGREWPSISALARDIGKSEAQVRRWLNAGDDDRLLAALMAADARRTAAAMRDAEMTDRISRRAA